MQILLAMAAAVAWGSANFTMGVAGRRSNPRITVLVAFGAGLMAAVIFLLVQQPDFRASALGWGAVAGASQGLGWCAFSRALALGPISVAAPVPAVVTTVSLYAIGIAIGNPVRLISLLGAVLALGAISLLTRPQDVAAEYRAGRPINTGFGGLPFAVIAGAMFTFQSLALNQAGTASSSLVIVGAGVGVVAIMSATFLIRRVPREEVLDGSPLAALAGLVICGGDISYLYALNHGPLTTASVLAQLHPLGTVLLAQIILRERLKKPTAIGIACALVGASLISAG